ncbi:NAD-P-binding protein [Mycena vitilis]|nr:NAD-P-binding protein [Mycena vitilis]
MALPTFGFSTTSDEVVNALSSEIAGKNVLVTGTSQNGIGFDTARAIAKYAGLVIITGYNTERLQLSADAIRKEVPTANIRTVVLDLSSLAAVRKAAEEINAYSEPLHVLIHNAAHTSLAYSITVDDIESQMAVNHTSPFLLTKLLLPKLLASATPTWLPRVVFVSSEVQTMGPGLDLSAVRKPAPGSEQEKNALLRYHEAKSAGVLTALALAKRGAGKLRAYSLHPGVIFTNVHTKEAVVPVLKEFGTLKADGQPNPESTNWKTIPQGAATTVVAAFDPRLNDKSGSYLEDCVEANGKRAVFNSDPVSAEKLWKVTEEIVGEEFTI